MFTGLECEYWCVCVCVFMHWTGSVCVCVHALDWKCVCVILNYKAGQVDDAGWREKVANSQEKKIGRHTSSYTYLLYVDVSYLPANPDA